MICRMHFDLHYHVMLEMQVVNHDLSYLLSVVKHSFHLLKLRISLIYPSYFYCLLTLICLMHIDLQYPVMP